MSTMRNITVPADASRLPMTLPRLAEKKRLGEPLVMVTAYDYPSALAVDKAGVDLVLVGDSGAMTVLGYPSTVAVEVCGVRPTWPMTGMPAWTMARARATGTGPPPSSLTASQPASLTNRCAVAIACASEAS